MLIFDRIKAVLLFSCMGMMVCGAARAGSVLVEAESFAERGGWELDTQFIDIMGSPYLIAHGLGNPVKDAATTVALTPGRYRVWVRTKDWVAHWKAPGAPGKFQVLVDGAALAETFGSKGAEWFWHDGGTVETKGQEVKLALHDLTGFDGRCDAIYLTDEANFTPPNEGAVLAAWRKKALGLPEKPVDVGEFDLVVVGGGYGGMGAAIAAARAGCKVALIQDRPVLGGNGSSEVRVWAMGGTRRGLFPNLGEIVDEFADKAKLSPGTFEEFGDAKKEALVRAEKKISLYLNNYMIAVEMDGKKIVAVTALNTVTSAQTRFAGKYFADCTGHGSVGALAGADLTVKETGHMGMSNMWRWKNADAPQTFPDVSAWCLPLEMADFPYPQRFHAQWFWEGGFNWHPLNELEYIRDWNLRAVFGAFNAMKTKEKEKHLNAKLEWVAYVGGNRESRQLLGDVILTREDIVSQKKFEDGCVPTTWDIDLHYPKEQYAKKFPEGPFISKAEFGSGVDRKNGYPVPYRCMYSRNIENLFMAGRCISVTHEALGTVRVMKTGGMIGEVAGKAAAVCVKYACAPRDVYAKYFEELKELMNAPGKMRREAVTEKMALPPGETPLPPVSVHAKDDGPEGLDAKKLPGIVIDDVNAKLKGDWKSGHSLEGYVGGHYLYHAPGKGGAARFEFKVPATGKYDVRELHQTHENRATNAAATIESAEGSKTVKVNQRVAGKLPHGFVSLGVFKFEAGKAGAVTISTDGADGNVGVDAVQVVPAE